LFAGCLRKPAVLINEAQTSRNIAHSLSLLQGLYDQGFRYLAMEMLNNYKGTILNL
jgi:hypothetical protein